LLSCGTLLRLLNRRILLCGLRARSHRRAQHQRVRGDYEFQQESEIESTAIGAGRGCVHTLLVLRAD
jgi:hypothetical protein